jgi:nicotinamidase-related amidase
VQEAPDLRDARALEAEFPLELEGTRNEGRFLHASRLGAVLPVPSHFEPERVGEIWRVPYEERAREAEAWAREHTLPAAAEDPARICLVAVDVQNTFCIPEFELFVAGRSGSGAVDDNRRLCEFLYRNLDTITQVVPTLDTHQAMQVFHAVWLVDEEGRHPEPYTLVSAEDIASGRWHVDPAVAESLGFDPEYAQRHLAHYTRALAETGKYELTIWPYHALIGGIGHALVSAVEEAIFFHTIARRSQADFQPKGRSPLTEHYSVLGPEVTRGPDGEVLGEKNSALLEKLFAFDAVVIAGQAKSHCVAWTIDDLLTSERSLAERVYLLEDCTSPVVVPGVVDFTDQADAAFRRFAEAGMHVVRSTDPIESWPGIAASARA